MWQAHLRGEPSLCGDVIEQQAHGSNCHCSPRVAEDHGIKADAEGLQICCELVQAIAQPHRRLTIAARKPHSISADPSAGLCRNNTAENSNDTAFCKLWMILTVLHMVDMMRIGHIWYWQ